MSALCFGSIPPTMFNIDAPVMWKVGLTMSVFFSSEPVPADERLADLWYYLENEQFAEAINLAESVCQDENAPVEFYCGLSLAYGETGYPAEAEQVARTAVSFGEGNWRARHALAVALMHQGRWLGALDSVGFYRTPPELYLVRAQIEKMGEFFDGLRVTLEDALEQEVPPAVQLYLAYLYSALESKPSRTAVSIIKAHAAYLDVWQRDAARHQQTSYGEQLEQHIAAIQRLMKS